jgi:GntR family transcriptional regulator
VLPSIEVDLDAAVPVYQQIADGLRALIARGALNHGAELPSVRQLGAQVGVNLNTVARAYRILAEEGLVDLKQGAAAHVLAATPRGSSNLVLLDDDARRKLSDLFSRWRLKGATQREIERALREAAAEFFR